MASQREPDSGSAQSPAAHTGAGPSSEASYERLKAIFELAPIGIGIVDLEGRTVLTNCALRDMLGYSEEEFAATHFEQISHPGDMARNAELFAELVAGRSERFEMDKRFFHADGSVIWGHLTASLLRDDAGQPARAIGMLENVTEARRLEAQLKEAEATFRMLVEHVPAVVYVGGASPDAPWRYVSPQIEPMLGFTADEWLADPGLRLRQMRAEDRPAVIAAMSERLAQGPVEAPAIHYRMTRRDGGEIWLRDEFTIVRDRDGEWAFRGMLLDVTREKQLEVRLERQAFHDPLTQLANRELFGNRVRHCFERHARDDGQRRSAVIFVDLDDFKMVNDSLGHAAGDELICSVAKRIAGCVRPADTAGRLGGDEFAILLEDMDAPEDAVAVAERVQQALARPHRLKDKTLATSASIGVAYLADAGSTEAVLRNADLAMYRAKESGKSRIATYEPAMHAVAVRRLDIRSGLEDALERGELSVHLQPIVDLRVTRMVGAEALLRWTHPEFGAVGPHDFIPVAEETGSILAIGEWVLRQSCDWLSSQPLVAGVPLSVSVNVSPVQLGESSLVRVVEACLTSAGLEPGALVLEVTERALMSESSWRTLRDLKSLGVRIAIDDFGTGYASLAYLSELSIDLLKIDRSFVASLGGSERAEAVPRAVIQLAASLGLGVVAEGIETREQWLRLQRMGCSSGQGYLFARPMPPSALNALVGQALGDAANGAGGAEVDQAPSPSGRQG